MWIIILSILIILGKRFIHEGKYYPKRQYEELNREESELLDTILREIKRLHPEVHKELIRVKRFKPHDLDYRVGHLV